MLKSELSPANLILMNEAIQKTFPDKEWQLIEKLSKGLSASLIYKIEIEKELYVIKLDDPAHPHNNLEREYDAMSKSSARKIAPKLFYADSKKGVSIIKFITTPSLSLTDYGKPSTIENLAALIRTLHKGPAFKVDMTVFKKVDAVYSIIPADFKKLPIVTKALEVKNNLETLLDNEEDVVPAHGDINVYNILCTEKQLLLIDWNTSGQQNRYFDLAACFTSFYFLNEEASAKFVETYFERKLTPVESSKYTLMKTFISLYYGFMFMYTYGLTHSTPMPESDISALPSYPDFIGALIKGEERLESSATQQKFSFVFFKNALSQTVNKDFLESAAVLKM